MRSIKKTNKRLPKKLLLPIGTIVVLLILYSGTAYAIKLWPFNLANSVVKEAPQDSSDHTTATDLSTNNTPSTNQTAAPGTTNTAKDTPVDNNTQQSNGSAVSIPFAQQNGDILQITTLITGVSGTGTCTLTLTKGSDTITLPTVNVQAGPSSSTCQGFNVPISSQPKLTSGIWNISIALDAGTTKATATSKVTIK